MSVGPIGLTRERALDRRPARSAVLDRLAAPALTLATGLAAAAPVIASTVRALRDGWVPTDDKGITATLAHDVLSGHTPLVGQFSNAGDVSHHLVYNLGPTLFWLLALPARFGAPGSMVVTMGLVNTVCILATVGLARRRGGPGLMLATGVAVGLVCRSLAAETFHDIWNAAVPLFPFLALIFLAWSLACGEHRLLPAAVLAASFVAQAHLVYVAPAAGLLAVGAGGLAVSVAARRRASPPPGAAAAADPAWRRSLVRWGLAAALVGAICWTPPVIQQLRDHHGNLAEVARTAAARRVTLGPAIGWHVVARTVGVRPWWLIDPATRWDRYHDALARPSTTRTVSALVLLAALAGLAVAGVRRRRRDLAAAAVIGLVLCAALAADAAGTPKAPHLASTLGYTMWWASAAGMFVWLMLAWSLWLLVAGVAGPRLAAAAGRRRGRLPGWRAAAAGGLAVVAATGVAVAAGGRHDQHIELYPPIRAIAAGLDRLVPGGRTVLLEGRFDGSTAPMRSAVRYLLVRRSIRVLGAGSFLRLGYWYEAYHRPHDFTIYLDDRPGQRHPGAILAARASFSDPAGAHVVSAWVTPTPPPR